MNLFTVSTGAGVSNHYKTKSIFGLHNGILKSTQEKMERQQKAENEIAFWEKQKENLKQKECDTVEEIAKKLEAFHNYEDEIAAVKKAYNLEQMSHILDEAEEQGKKNAEAAEKLEPKTPEERKEELVEEALGTDEEGESVLEEILDETTKNLEESQEQLDEAAETLDEAAETLDETAETLDETQEQLLDKVPKGLTDSSQEQFTEKTARESQEWQRLAKNGDWIRSYQKMDIRV